MHLYSSLNAKYLQIWTFLIANFFSKLDSYLSAKLGHVGQRLDKKADVNSKFYDVTNWEINYYIMHIAQE